MTTIINYTQEIRSREFSNILSSEDEATLSLIKTGLPSNSGSAILIHSAPVISISVVFLVPQADGVYRHPQKTPYLNHSKEDLDKMLRSYRCSRFKGSYIFKKH